MYSINLYIFKRQHYTFSHSISPHRLFIYIFLCVNLYFKNVSLIFRSTMSIAQHYFYATMTFFCFYILSHSSMTSKYVVPMMRRKITSPPCLTFCLTEVYFLSFRGSTLPILERLFYTQIAMSKIIYVIPGYPHTTSMDMYKPLLALLKEQQFNIVPVSITWKYRVMSDYCKEFLKQYTKHTKTDEVYIL